MDTKLLVMTLGLLGIAIWAGAERNKRIKEKMVFGELYEGNPRVSLKNIEYVNLEGDFESSALAGEDYSREAQMAHYIVLPKVLAITKKISPEKYHRMKKKLKKPKTQRITH